jgi:hypothetical protein
MAQPCCCIVARCLSGQNNLKKKKSPRGAGGKAANMWPHLSLCIWVIGVGADKAEILSDGHWFGSRSAAGYWHLLCPF